MQIKPYKIMSVKAERDAARTHHLRARNNGIIHIQRGFDSESEFATVRHCNKKKFSKRYILFLSSVTKYI